MTINIGLQDNQRKDIADALSKVLANTHALYVKTQGYHWNVTGTLFKSLHDMFEEQYTELAEARDDLAERIRVLGVFAPYTPSRLQELADLSEDSDVPDAKSMIGNLAADNEAIARQLRVSIPQAADAGDEASADLMVERARVHEKTAWMLRALLNEN